MSDWGNALPPAVVEVTCGVTESSSVLSCAVCVSGGVVFAVVDCAIVVVTSRLVVIAAEWFSFKVGRAVGLVIGPVLVVVGLVVGPFVGPSVGRFVNPMLGLVVIGLVVGLAVVAELTPHRNENFAL